MKMKTLTTIWNYLSGKKTYILGVSGLIWGTYTSNEEIIYTALGLMGLRHGVSNGK